MSTKKINVNRNHKDTVFRMLFRKKEALLSLYNVLNGTNYQDESDLEVVTLENAVFLRMRNDAAFVFRERLYVCEHQSTVNCNMPLRQLFYASDTLRAMIPVEQLFHRKMVMVPEPKFVVFYNGTEFLPERTVYYLSEHYMTKPTAPELELKVTVYNINKGNNRDLVESCELLNGYVEFVHRIRENQKNMEVGSAILTAIDSCIKDGILKEFLERERMGVMQASWYEIDENKFWEEERMYAREEGLEEGRAAGLKEGRAVGLEEGRASGLEEGILLSIRNLMKAMSCTADEAMASLLIAPEERGKYLAKL